MEAYASDGAFETQQGPWERFGLSFLIALAALAVLICAFAVGIGPKDGSYLLLIPFGAVLAARHPVAASLLLFVLLGFSGTLAALSPITPRGPTEFIVYSLWAGVGWHLINSGRPRIWLWPAVFGPALYVAATLVTALLADPVSTGWDSFSESILWMSGFLAVALSPWARERNRQLALGVIGIGILVGVYCVFRYVVGPSGSEEQAARAALPGFPHSEALHFYGSQLTAQQLALWCATVIPFCLSMVLAWRGRPRIAGAVAVALLGFCLIASEIRTGLIACGAAILVTLLLFQLCSAFPAGTRTGATLTALVAIAVLGAGGFALTVGKSDEGTARLLRIFDPGNDPAYSTRLDRWKDAWPLVTDEPFGHGLGTVGAVALQGEFLPITAVNLDSSYLKIGVEQGLAMMVLFIASMVLLGVTLARRAVGARDPTRAAIAIGACGSLVAMMVMFYAGFFIENREVMMAWFLIGLGVAQFSILGDGDERSDGPSSGQPQR